MQIASVPQLLVQGNRGPIVVWVVCIAIAVWHICWILALAVGSVLLIRAQGAGGWGDLVIEVANPKQCTCSVVPFLPIKTFDRLMFCSAMLAEALT